MEKQRVEARSVSMYPAQWQVVDQVARRLARMTGGKPETSSGLRRVVEEYREMKELAKEGGEGWPSV